MTSTKADWSWKEYKGKGPKLSKLGKRKAKKKRQKQLTTSQPNNFYTSDEWRRIRYRVIAKHEGACMACGRSKKLHGVVLHVDHIKPRSKYPELALQINNLQILCADCNLGKGNKCEIDWRPELKEESQKIDVNELVRRLGF